VHRRAIAATTAALLAMFLVAVPASADNERTLTPAIINWPLAAILTVLALAVFYYVLEGMNQGR
jgi:ABC-type proline/glycine betaine transport system substrate-binding protein